MDEATWSYCNHCSGERKHELLHKESPKWKDEVSSVEGGNIYELLRCLGCEAITLRHIKWCSEWNEPEIAYYPPVAKIKAPDWLDMAGFWFLFEERHIEDILFEIYASIGSGCRRLPAMGIRSLLEHIMISKVGDQGNFAANVSAFQKAGYISEKQKANLNTIIDVGHAAMHRSFNPSLNDLTILLEITESLVESIYIHEAKAIELGNRVPKRSQGKGKPMA